MAASTGEAMKIDEKVPVKIPKNMITAKGRTTSPPKIARAARVASAVPPVSTVRGSVSFTERLSTSPSGGPRRPRRFSLTRSKITMVSLSE
jgi:hypothetical protein